MAALKFLLKFVIILAVVIGVGAGLAIFAARFADGPVEIVAGGPFTSGEWVSDEPSWDFIKDRDTVELQLVEPASSRTTWIAVHEGRVFIPSGYMTTWWGKIWKQWPVHAEQDGRAVLRVDGKLYERRLVRILDDPAVEPVLAELSRKYGGGQPFPREVFDSGYLWLFELVRR